MANTITSNKNEGYPENSITQKVMMKKDDSEGTIDLSGSDSG